MGNYKEYLITLTIVVVGVIVATAIMKRFAGMGTKVTSADPSVAVK